MQQGRREALPPVPQLRAGAAHAERQRGLGEPQLQLACA